MSTSFRSNVHPTWVLLALASLLGGCQSTSIRSAWFDTEFAGPPLRKIVVVGSIDSVADGRVFEDAFAERLRANGIEGIAGHAVIPDAARASDPAFVAAVVNSGAQGLLLVRLLGVDTRTQVSTTMVPGGMAWGRGGWGGLLHPHDVPRAAGQPIRSRRRRDEAVRRAEQAADLGGHDEYAESADRRARNARIRRCHHRPAGRSRHHPGQVTLPRRAADRAGAIDCARPVAPFSCG